MINKNIYSLVLTGLIITSCFSQDDLQTRYANEITVNGATKHLSILASDEFEGRETGKPGAKKAAGYIAEEFKKLGLTAPVNGSYFQKVELTESRFSVDEFQINDEKLTSSTDYYAVSNGQSGRIESDSLLFIGYGISDEKYDDLKGLSLEGKTVLLINEGEPVNAEGVSYVSGTKDLSEWATSRNKRLQYVMSLNPSLVIATSSEVENLLERTKSMGPQGRMRLTEDVKESAPEKRPLVAYLPEGLVNRFIETSQTSLEELKASINESGKPQSRTFPTRIVVAYNSINEPVDAENVLGYMEGTDLKDELLVISAHYDHIGINPDGQINNGADDDGSGTTGVLELATAFAKAKKDGKGPRRSILFLTVVGEEKGLLGSDYYTRHPVFPLKSTITDLNIDMIGRIDPQHEDNREFVYLVGSDKLSSTLHRISEEANEKYTRLALDYRLNDPNDPERIYYRSDHYNFAKNGIPVIFYFNGIHADYHDVGDTVDKIEFDLLVKRSQLVFYTAWDLVNRDERPAVDSNKK